MDRKGGEKEMKMTKLTIFMLAVVAIGIFALPSTLSVGVGQHKFRTYGTVETDGAAFCAQCHKSGDTVSNELLASDTRDTAAMGYGGIGDKIHSSIWCGDCHEITEGYEVAAVSTEHAAKNPSCLKCHGAGNTYGYNDVTVELSQLTESHKNFVVAGDDDVQCIACHTYVTKEGTITYTFDTSFGVVSKGLTIGSNAAMP
jgi:hypothetical protein